MTLYRKLQSTALPADAGIAEIEPEPTAAATMDDPALSVMTDLRHVRAVTVAPDGSLEIAHQRMIHAKVRLLLVADAEGSVVGLLTARDLLGEKPVRAAVADGIARSAVRVERVMVRREQIEVLDLAEVERSRVGDVVATLRASGRQHALVLERGRPPQIRGVFSTTRVGHQLGLSLDASERPQSFAEIEHLLAGS